ncbi:hypothetical protein [Lutimonas sp.]|uniref:hypothetical protein n=1 Tax=Lutimonas sp. TaxID=1872403 RepID=UPI003D9B22F0
MKNLDPLFLVLIMLISFQSAKAQSKSKSIDPTELEVLKKVVTSDSIPTVYFKTIVTDLNQPLSRQLFYLSEFDLCNSLVNLDSVKLRDDERRYIVDRFSNMESQNINKLIRDPKNFSLKQLQGHNWFQISMPVVFRDGKFAIYYSKGAYSGQFILMKNIDGYWRDVCYSSVWSE